jgi:Zn-dependent M28 family amino/carboxypeptidase
MRPAGVGLVRAPPHVPRREDRRRRQLRRRQHLGPDRRGAADRVREVEPGRLRARGAARQGRTVTDEPFPDRGFFYRSDQFSFARIGVPSLYFDTATSFLGRAPGWGKERIEAYENELYHQPGDELAETWVFDGMVEDARFAFVAGLLVAQADVPPSWVPGDEFERQRRR